jgi:hypothetical protein
MPDLQRQVMERLYGRDIWAEFTPDRGLIDPQGWNGDHPALQRLAGAGGSIVIDVGVWKGQSTISMALAMKNAGIDGCVIAVDTFLGSVENWTGEGELFARVVGRPNLYETFLNNVVAAEATGYIVPLAQTSATAALILHRAGIRASVIHVDAAHDYEAVLQDIKVYWELLIPHGYMIGDDYHEIWPGVVRAAGEFSASTGRPLTIEPHKWILQHP